MSVAERDEDISRMQDTGRDVLQPPELRAVIDPLEEKWLCLDHPDSDNEDEWLEADTWVEAGDWR